MTQSLDEKHDIVGHTNFKFDEEGAEWQALITQNSYEANIFMNLDMPQLQNFGTVDNPHLIYTSEVPFRFVACAGPPSEDDFEYHENLWFLLREGPLQRCTACGQVFKLVRLRDEFSPENDYYMTGLTQSLAEEYGEQDVITNISLFRPFMFYTFNHTHFEVPSNYMYSMMRMDDHDRYLTDPAFRMEQNKLAEEKYKVMIDTMDKLDQHYKEAFGESKIESISKEEYQNIIDTEKSIEVLNEHFRKIQKFKIRNIIDPENHERRENRMLMRSLKRTESSLINGKSEEALQIDDYYETDNELDIEFENNKLDEAVLKRTSNHLDRFEFHETYTLIMEGDTQTLVQDTLFKYRNRLAHDGKQKYLERETARKASLNEWVKNSKYSSVLEKLINVQKKIKSSDQVDSLLEDEYTLLVKQKMDLEIELGILNYSSYFGTEHMSEVIDTTTNRTRLDILNDLSPTLKLHFAQMCDINLSDNINNQRTHTNTTDENNGFLENLMLSYKESRDIERNIVDLGNNQMIYASVPEEIVSEVLDEYRGGSSSQDFVINFDDFEKK